MPLVSKALKSLGIKEIVIHTGQHYDKNMSCLFFEELGLRKPDYNLRVKNGPSYLQLADMLFGLGRVLAKERPSLVLLYGDTNSTLAGAIAAVKAGIRIAHIEAGLRSFNADMPEEINRVLTDSVSSIFFCPTRTALNNLKKEGKIKNAYLVGDVMFDSIKYFSSKLKKPATRGRYILCTVHRAENTDDPCRLTEIFYALGKAGEKVVMPLHPRTAKYIKKYRIGIESNIEITLPASYFEMLSLERNADIIVTDSGGVQKEAYIFGIPCVTLRNETEWVETVSRGNNFLAGADSGKILAMLRKAAGIKRNRAASKFYGDGFAHNRIARIINKSLMNDEN
ncbi:MAG: UDP-N-acetylglucosamine 2-epimerase (non-hydrolyzing) [Candidatus Omnitrophica bacterium]|nr:UDP-N-acetylglucosamine 2-epimerase (non-hydrolyzing) [Candidatus Omnitrophota bacterium]